MDDLWSSYHWILSLLPYCNCHPTVLSGKDLEYPPVFADSPVSRSYKVFLCQLPERKHCDGVYVSLFSVVYVKPSPCQNICNCHDKQSRLGHIRKKNRSGQFHRTHSYIRVVLHPLGRSDLHYMEGDKKAILRNKTVGPDDRCNTLCLLLGYAPDFICGSNHQVWQAEEGTAIRHGARRMMYPVSLPRCRKYIQNLRDIVLELLLMGMEICHQGKYNTAAWTWRVTCFMGLFSFFQSKTVNHFQENKHRSNSCFSFENGATFSFMHFLLCICLTVLCSIYLTGHAYVVGHGKQGIWKVNGPFTLWSLFNRLCFDLMGERQC